MHKLPSFVKGGHGVPVLEKLKAIQDQSLKKEEWWLKKKGRFSGSTWINCHIQLKVPSERALNLVNSIEPGEPDSQQQAVTQFLID